MKLLIATPTHSGQTCMDFTIAVSRTLVDLHQHGIAADLMLYQGSILPHSRNTLAAAALELGCTHLLFVDSDMGWEPPAVRQLLAHGVDLVAGIYQTRVTGAAHCLANPRRGDRPRLLEVDALGCGFMLIARQVLERLTAAWGRHHLFAFAVDGNGVVGEDFTFCAKARGLGFKVYADPLIRLRHHGQAVFDMTWAEAHQLGRPVAARSMPVIPPPPEGRG